MLRQVIERNHSDYGSAVRGIHNRETFEAGLSHSVHNNSQRLMGKGNHWSLSCYLPQSTLLCLRIAQVVPADNTNNTSFAIYNRKQILSSTTLPAGL